VEIIDLRKLSERAVRTISPTYKRRYTMLIVDEDGSVRFGGSVPKSPVNHNENL
jgi:hypothetical protein